MFLTGIKSRQGFLAGNFSRKKARLNKAHKEKKPCNGDTGTTTQEGETNQQVCNLSITEVVSEKHDTKACAKFGRPLSAININASSDWNQNTTISSVEDIMERCPDDSKFLEPPFQSMEVPYGEETPPENTRKGEIKEAIKSFACNNLHQMEDSMEGVCAKIYVCAFCTRRFEVNGEVDASEIRLRLEHFKKCAQIHRCTNPMQYRNFLMVTYNKTSSSSPSNSCAFESGFQELLNEIKKEQRNKSDERTASAYESAKVGGTKSVNSVLMSSARRLSNSEVSKQGFGKLKYTPNRNRSKKKVNQTKLREKQKKFEAPLCKRVPGTDFVVDGFKYRAKVYFLTHFHSDHYEGLNASTFEKASKLYCTPETSKLLQLKLKINSGQIMELPFGQYIQITKNMHVTAIPANHCPGSAMLLFHDLLINEKYLHTGDFRYDGLKLPSFCYPLSTVYLDTTYCNPTYSFPSQGIVIQNACKLAKKYCSNPNTLVVFGTYTIGKEKLFSEVAKEFGNPKIAVSADKLQILKCLDSFKSDRRLTTDKNSTRFYVTTMQSLKMDHLCQLINRSNYKKVVAFRPTGWSKNATVKHHPSGKATVISLPYSEHSSFTELRQFVQEIKQNQAKSPQFISTVKPQSCVSMLL